MFISLINPQMFLIFAIVHLCFLTVQVRVKSYWPLTQTEYKALTHSYGTKQKTEDRV